MAKHKSRADRKSRRQRASHAQERGLPALPSESMDHGRAAPARRSGRRRPQPSQNRSAWLAVLIGALVALAVVFMVAQRRKASVLTGPEQPTSATPSQKVSVP